MLCYREVDGPVLRLNYFSMSTLDLLTSVFLLSHLPLDIPSSFLFAPYKYRLGSSLPTKTFCFEIGNPKTDSSRRSFVIAIADEVKRTADYLTEPHQFSSLHSPS